jgi:hypothetical protein
MAARKLQNWRQVKAKIILRYGTISAAAAALGCSAEGIRQSVSGKCPGIARKLEAQIGKVA